MAIIPNRRDFLKLTGTSLSCLPLALCSSKGRNSSKRPNVILILTDDQGFGDLCLRGNPYIKTPNLDRFGSEGIELDRFYCEPVCAPTRASILTGRYYYRTGVIHTSRGGSKMHGDEVTIAELLRDSGYATGIFGKWHLGDNYPMRPQDQGFSTSLIHRSWGISAAPDDWNSYFDPVLWKDGVPIETKGYCTDLFTEALLEFMENNQKQPFFAYLSTNTPHTPLQVARGYSEPYEEMGLDEETSKIYGMITNIDENVGRLLEKLDDLGLREDTLVIFLTDNGPQQNRYNSGLRDRKTSTYEGGIRVPFLLQWPARFQRLGRISQIAAHIDILPTILDAGQVPLTDQVATLDGRSLLPLLDGSENNWDDRHLIFQCHRGLTPKAYQNCAVITQRYKLVGFPGTFSEENLDTTKEAVFELYDLEADPGEKTDLSEMSLAIVADLKAKYDSWYRDVKSTRQFTPELIHLGSPHENPVLLCRYQDGTYRDGKSLGWDVLVERPGRYEVKVKQEAFSGPGRVYLSRDGEVSSQSIPPGENRATFDLAEGAARLDIWMQEDGQPRMVFVKNDSVGNVQVTKVAPLREP